MTLRACINPRAVRAAFFMILHALQECLFLKHIIYDVVQVYECILMLSVLLARHKKSWLQSPYLDVHTQTNTDAPLRGLPFYFSPYSLSSGICINPNDQLTANVCVFVVVVYCNRHLTNPQVKAQSYIAPHGNDDFHADSLTAFFYFFYLCISLLHLLIFI